MDMQRFVIRDDLMYNEIFDSETGRVKKSMKVQPTSYNVERAMSGDALTLRDDALHGEPDICWG